MNRFDNFSKFLIFREKYKYFSFEEYSWQIVGNSLNIEYVFNLSGKYSFRPQVKIALKPSIYRSIDILSSKLIDKFIFHTGMIEMISYWKAACPKNVIINAGKLDAGQVDFWKKIYYQGLGEFFYLNSISTDPEEFMEITPEPSTLIPNGKDTGNDYHLDPASRPIVPIGGGKDSVVTLELLKNSGIEAIPMVINPIRASLDVIRQAGQGMETTAEISRQIDPMLLNLNKIGFLNGHTPFSAMLAFYTLLIAYLSGSKDIILSNESSASEATVPGTNINHQYSKSFEFENDFRAYTSRYISPDFNYFSMLRPLSELQIASLFSRYKKYHGIFRSCNAGSKTGSWCGHCPKCLFTWVILSPFLSGEELTGIFNNNLFMDESLSGTLDELSGVSEIKPFECIGTVDEVRLALDLALAKYSGKEMPYLLKHYQQQHKGLFNGVHELETMLKELNNEHFVPQNYLNIITRALDE